MNFSQWTVWLANLDPIIGSEQGKTRPVIIISKSSLNGILPVVNVIPITSRKANRRIYPNEALLSPGAIGLIVESIALCHQIRTLDKRRLTRRLGILSD
jgi:mRNA interferase MazF